MHCAAGAPRRADAGGTGAGLAGTAGGPGPGAERRGEGGERGGGLPRARAWRWAAGKNQGETRIRSLCSVCALWDLPWGMARQLPVWLETVYQ